MNSDVFVGVETLLNSPPLTTLSADTNDEPVLIPDRFIVGQLESRSKFLAVKISFVLYLYPLHFNLRYLIRPEYLDVLSLIQPFILIDHDKLRNKLITYHFFQYPFWQI